MFTPESLASENGSPYLKRENIHGSPDPLIISDVQRCCLRQLLNDSDLSPTKERISVRGLLKYARQFMANEELRPKTMRLLLGIIHGNRAKSGLYDLLTDESTQLSVLLTTMAQGGERVIFWATLAVLALETGQRPFPSPPILVRVCESQGPDEHLLNLLTKLLMSSGDGKGSTLTDCLMATLCEYPETGPRARAILAINLEAIDTQVEHLWARAMDESNLSSLFLLFRLLQVSKMSRNRLATSVTGPWKVTSLVTKLKMALVERGKFPYVYMYLCILHVILAPEEEGTECFLIEALSKPEVSGRREGSWWTLLLNTQVAPSIDGIMLELLHLWCENTIRRGDEYVDTMLTAILSIMFMGVRRIPERVLDTLKELEKSPADPLQRNSIRTWLSFMKRDEALWARLAAQYPRLWEMETPPYQHVRFRLEPDPTSVAFFVPLLQAELHQHYSTIIKSLGV